MKRHCSVSQVGGLNFKQIEYVPFKKIRLVGPFKPYLAENISLQRSNCNIFGLTATVTFFAKEDRFTQI